MFTAVGSALSYWEGAEDVLMGLFKWLCGDTEPIAVASYIQAPRKVREAMLDLAIEIHGHRMLPDETVQIRQALARLKKLAPVRNEIAHGHVSEKTETELRPEGSKIVASGLYLLPSLNEGDWHERTYRFHHTVDTIVAFQEEVRDHRWTIIQTHTAAQVRELEGEARAGPETYMQRLRATEIATRKIKADEWDRYMRPMDEWSKRNPPGPA
jgi:hypothetical protein